jgi:putative CocE/NonD family hydrolase
VTFASEPLTRDTEVTGPITARLFASTTARDTDFVIKVVDVFPDDSTTPQPGYWNHVSTGNIKGTFRSYKGRYATATAIPTGKVVQYEIQARPTSYLFKKGHRIAFIISSALVPKLMPNTLPAQVTIFHSAQYPSSVTLPIIPR